MDSLILAPFVLVIFYIWRLWEHLHGRTWKPEGKPPQRLQAMHDYLDTLPPPGRRDKTMLLVTIVATLTLMGVFVWAMLHFRSN